MKFDNFSAIDSGIKQNSNRNTNAVVTNAPRVTRKLRERKRLNFFFGVAGAEGFEPYTLPAGQVIPNATINDIGASFIDIKQNEFDLGIRDINLGDFDIVFVTDTSLQDPTSTSKNISGFDVKNGAIVTIRLNKDVEVGVPTTAETAMAQAGETPMADASVLRTATGSTTTTTQSPLKNIGLLAVGFFGGVLLYKFILKK
jgi:hypothetical protein